LLGILSGTSPQFCPERHYYVPFSAGARMLVTTAKEDELSMTWLNLALLIIASYRLTHLIVFDSIMEPVRDSLVRVPFIGQVVTCYWCCGIWVSAALVAAHLLWPAVTFWVVLILAVAGGQAILETLIGRD
jgi:hypothetical protein